jgi:hypothetical protein
MDVGHVTAPETQGAPADDITLADLLHQFRMRLDDPRMPLPDSQLVRRHLFAVPKPSAKRNRRLTAKQCGPSSTTIKRAQRILMQKLRIYHDEEGLSTTQLQEYTRIFASPLGPEQVAAIAALFGLECTPTAEDVLVVAPAI